MRLTLSGEERLHESWLGYPPAARSQSLYSQHPLRMNCTGTPMPAYPVPTVEALGARGLAVVEQRFYRSCQHWLSAIVTYSYMQCSQPGHCQSSQVVVREVVRHERSKGNEGCMGSVFGRGRGLSNGGG